MTLYGALPTASYPISQYMPIAVLDPAQLRSVHIIEQVAEQKGVPPLIAMAMVANAHGESDLDPNAVWGYKPWSGKDHLPMYGKEDSIGLFQLNAKGAGKGMSVAQRKDPVLNTERIIEELHATRRYPTLAGALPPYSHEHPLDAYERGVTDLGYLTAMFQSYVERARYTTDKDTRRRAAAKRFFPDFYEGSTAPVASDRQTKARTRKSRRAQDAAYWENNQPSRIELRSPRGVIVPTGTIPAGTYYVYIDNSPQKQMVHLPPGSHYVADIYGRSFSFIAIKS